MSSNLVIPENELPNWMKQAQRGVDWGAILVLGFCLIIAWQFISHDSLSALNDSEHFVYRTSDYAEAIKEGHLYSRWSPQALMGYGAEIPNFYPPGAAYIAAIIEVLFTNDSIAAVRFTYIIAIFLAGSMVYALVKHYTNAVSGVFASLLYLFSPYVALNVPHEQGDLALALGLALLPSLLWGINRILTRNHTIDYMVITAVCAAIIVTKPALILQAILLAIALIIAYVYTHKLEWAKLWLVFSAFVAGIGLAAFYWIPALLERGFVKWSNPLISVTESRLSLAGLFERSKIIDDSILIHETQFNLGWLLIGFTILSIISVIYWHKNYYFPVPFLICSLLLTVFGLTLFKSHTELLAGIVLGMAIAGSYPISILPKNGVGMALTSLALLLVYLGAIPIWKLSEAQLQINSRNLLTQNEYEQNGFGLAVLEEGLAIPSFVSPHNSNLGFSSKDTSAQNWRLRNTNLQTTLLERNTFGETYQVFSDEDASLDNILFLRAYSIAWQASLDERPLEISADADGLVQIHFPSDLILPANTTATLRISYGTTPIRIVSWAASAISIILIFYIAWRRWQSATYSFDTSDLLSRQQIIVVTLLFGMGIALRYNPVIEWVNPYLPYPESTIMDNTISVKNESTELTLLRFAFGEQVYHGGDKVDLSLYWSLEDPVKYQHQVRLRILNRANQATVFTNPFSYPSQFPTNRLPRNLIIIDSYTLELPQDLEAGSYTILLDVASCPSICLEGASIASQNITTIQLPLNLMIED